MRSFATGAVATIVIWKSAPIWRRAQDRDGDMQDHEKVLMINESIDVKLNCTYTTSILYR